MYVDVFVMGVDLVSVYCEVWSCRCSCMGECECFVMQIVVCLCLVCILWQFSMLHYA